MGCAVRIAEHVRMGHAAKGVVSVYIQKIKYNNICIRCTMFQTSSEMYMCILYTEFLSLLSVLWCLLSASPNMCAWGMLRKVS